MNLRLLASLVFAPMLAACASAGAVAPAPVVAASTTPTTVFLETAGMELAPPTACDYTVATAALDAAIYGEPESVRPACESACRVETCQGMVIQAEVMGAMYYDEFDGLLPQLAEQCEQTVDGCMGVAGVVMLGESLESIGLEPAEWEEEEEPETEEPASPADPAVEAACDNGDAAACYALVDLDLVLQGWEQWQQPAREVSLARWQTACDLEPMVYCRGLELAIDYTTDEGCGG